MERAMVAVGFGLPEELAAVLPVGPFEQLGVTRKITSIALSYRAESEAAEMHTQLAQCAAAEDVRERVERLESALELANDCLSCA